jgi:eukaryotic-like serine/threonine-protein kinase
MASKIIGFIRSKTFLTHLLLSMLAVFLVLIGTYQWLNAYTNHGETITVPNLVGRKFTDLEKLLEGKSMLVKIADSSVFILDKPPGVVIEQDPAPNEMVKEGRTIYVTITRTVPPQVKVPNLVDVSQRQAEAILASYGLKVGQLIYKPDLAKNAVLSMLFKGRELRPGDDLEKGSTVDLVLGDGIGNTEVVVPSLKGLTYDEVLFVLQGSSVNPGAIVFDESVQDTAEAFVYRQIPEPGDSAFIKQGEAIDLFFTQNREKLK